MIFSFLHTRQKFAFKSPRAIKQSANFQTKMTHFLQAYGYMMTWDKEFAEYSPADIGAIFAETFDLVDQRNRYYYNMLQSMQTWNEIMWIEWLTQMKEGDAMLNLNQAGRVVYV